MGAAWDHDRGGRRQWIAWLAEILVEALRCCKPGAYALVWALPRTSHWTATALEDAGWCIQDVITHHFGTGFPKSTTHLKPASEHWILAYAPGKRALHVEACRIPANAADDGVIRARKTGNDSLYHLGFQGEGSEMHNAPGTAGRWPANMILSHSPECVQVGTKRVPPATHYPRGRTANHIYGDGRGTSLACAPEDTRISEETVEAWDCADDCPVRLLDAQSGVSKSTGGRTGGGLGKHIYGHFNGTTTIANHGGLGDMGGASRFFYTAKPSRRERDAGLPPGMRNTHPTVKSIALMSYLCRLVTAPGGTVLDCFAGSGTTGLACIAEGFRFVGIEQEAAHITTARLRLEHASAQLPLTAAI